MLIHNATVVCFDDENRVIDDGAVRYSGSTIDAVGASAEQRTQIRQIMEAARADQQTRQESGRALHEQMRQLFTQPTVDANVAEALRQQQLALHDAGSKRMLQAMLEASRVLTYKREFSLGRSGSVLYDFSKVVGNQRKLRTMAVEKLSPHLLEEKVRTACNVSIPLEPVAAK